MEGDAHSMPAGPAYAGAAWFRSISASLHYTTRAGTAGITRRMGLLCQQMFNKLPWPKDRGQEVSLCGRTWGIAARLERDVALHGTRPAPLASSLAEAYL